MTRPEWMHDAACVDADPDLFHDHDLIARGFYRDLCRGCAVAAECYDYARRNGETHGIWGGVNFYSKAHRKTTTTAREAYGA